MKYSILIIQDVDSELVYCQDVNEDDKKIELNNSTTVLITKLNIKKEDELCMKAMTVPNPVSIVNDPNIFIRDSGAFTHST